MKASELRNLSDEELERKLGEGRQELFKIRFQAATGSLESSAQLRQARREIARILTIQNQRATEHERATEKV
ncbi:MAG: 50S ribosomal protein L29 [Gaiellaceae bacterium]